MEGHASISPEILASYAADAARAVAGVRGLVESRLPPHRGVRVSEEEGRVSIELHLDLHWGSSMLDVGRAVQADVSGYLARMADVETPIVNVVVASVGARP